MLNYKNSITSHNKLNNSDLPTAVKSRYYSYQPPNIIDNTSKLSAKKHNKIYQTKNQTDVMIENMINQMINKKKDNLNAIEHIKATNTQAINILNMERNQQDSTPMRMNQEQQQQYHQQQQPQQYQPLNTPINNVNFGSQYNMNQGNNPQLAETQQNRQLSPLEQENIQLRRALNDQIRQNNQLMKRLKFLQAENQDLRNQLRMGMQGSKTGRSTNYNSMNHIDLNKANNRQNQSVSPSIRNNRIPETISRINQNLSNGLNLRINIQNNNPLISQLNQLKKQNQQLRQNVIHLLKNDY